MPKYGKVGIMFNAKDAKQEKELYELIRELDLWEFKFTVAQYCRWNNRGTNFFDKWVNKTLYNKYCYPLKGAE